MTTYLAAYILYELTNVVDCVAVRCATVIAGLLVLDWLLEHCPSSAELVNKMTGKGGS